jgi:polar amino acid transport system substrate-binding protein
MSGNSWTRRDFFRRSGALGALAVVGGGLTVATGCSRVALGDEPNGGTLLDRLREAGEVRVGFANESPYSFINTDAEITGEAAELAKVIFHNLGIDKVTPIPSEFGNLIPGLKVGLFDVIGAGMFVTPERCAEVLFTNPDYEAKAAFLVPEGNPQGIQTYQDAAKKGISLGVLIGAVERDYALKGGVSGDQLTSYPDALSGMEAVTQGRVDAFSLTRISLQDTLNKNPGTPVEITKAFVPEVDGVPQRTGGAFAFLKDQQNIVDAFNGELDKLKQSGDLLEIVKPFGFSEAEMTDLKATDLCTAPTA